MSAVAMVTDRLNVLTWEGLNGNLTAWGQIKGQKRDGVHLISDYLLPYFANKFSSDQLWVETNGAKKIVIFVHRASFQFPARWNCSHLRELWNY